MTKIYIEDIAYAIEDALDADYGITDGRWAVGIEAAGDPYIELIDEDTDDVDIEIEVTPDVPSMSTEELFEIIFGDQKEDAVTLANDNNGFFTKGKYEPVNNPMDPNQVWSMMIMPDGTSIVMDGKLT